MTRMGTLSIQLTMQMWHIKAWWSIAFAAIASFYLILNLFAAYGMFYVKKWGFIITYIAIIYSTILFSHPYIPFIGSFINILFSIHHYYVTLILLNLIVFCYTIHLHRFYQRLTKSI